MRGSRPRGSFCGRGASPWSSRLKQRIGGRVYSMRDPFTHGLYADAGAMRITRSHKLTLAFVEKFGLATHDFRMSNPEGWCHLFGRKHRFREVDAKPHLIGAHLDERERGVTCAAMWERALDPFVKELCGRRRRVDRDRRKYDGYSIREFLEAAGWSEGRDRAVRPADEPGIAHEHVVPGAPARGDGSYYTNMVANRRRHGSAAARDSCRELRSRFVSARGWSPSTRRARRRRPLPDRGGPRAASARPRHRHRSRSPCCATSRC